MVHYYRYEYGSIDYWAAIYCMKCRSDQRPPIPTYESVHKMAEGGTLVYTGNYPEDGGRPYMEVRRQVYK